MYAQDMSCVPPDYMRNQVKNAKMRAIVIDWLMEVQLCSYGSSNFHLLSNLDLKEIYMVYLLGLTSKA